MTDHWCWWWALDCHPNPMDIWKTCLLDGHINLGGVDLVVYWNHLSLFINGFLCSWFMFWCLRSFTFSALNIIWWDLNMESTSNITSVLKDRGIRFQPGQSHSKGSVFYSGTPGESEKGRKSSVWVHWTSPKLNTAFQTYFSTCSLFGKSAHCTCSVDGALFGKA